MRTGSSYALGALALIAALVTAASPARAQDEEAKERAMSLYEQATKKYNVGDWGEAVRLYKEAYDAYPAPEFLFNIGQAYRQNNDCKNGLFFYKRYLANKPDAANRAQVEGFIGDLRKVCKEQDAARDKQPDGPVPPDGQGGQTGVGTQSVTTTAGTGTGTETGTSGSVTTTVQEPAGPPIVAMHAGAGIGLVLLGDLGTTPQLSVDLGAGYPLPVGPVVLELGASATVTTLQWENAAMVSGTSYLWSVLANARAVYDIPVPGLSATGELGAGLLTFSGLDDDAAPVFLEPGLIADGAPSMLNIRASAGLQYDVFAGVAATFGAVYAWSPAKDGFRDGVSAIHRIDFLLGAAYKL